MGLREHIKKALFEQPTTKIAKMNISACDNSPRTTVTPRRCISCPNLQTNKDNHSQRNHLTKSRSAVFHDEKCCTNYFRSNPSLHCPHPNTATAKASEAVTANGIGNDPFEALMRLCSCPGPCSPPPCAGCNCLPPPCNVPAKCQQYMTGYYYYPYGTWFCGPYHVQTGPCGPCSGPIQAGGPCGPTVCVPTSGPCGPNGPLCNSCSTSCSGPCGPCGPLCCLVPELLDICGACGCRSCGTCGPCGSCWPGGACGSCGHSGPCGYGPGGRSGYGCGCSPCGCGSHGYVPCGCSSSPCRCGPCTNCCNGLCMNYQSAQFPVCDPVKPSSSSIPVTTDDPVSPKNCIVSTNMAPEELAKEKESCFCKVCRNARQESKEARNTEIVNAKSLPMPLPPKSDDNPNIIQAYPLEVKPKSHNPLPHVTAVFAAFFSSQFGNVGADQAIKNLQESSALEKLNEEPKRTTLAYPKKYTRI